MAAHDRRNGARGFFVALQVIENGSRNPVADIRRIIGGRYSIEGSLLIVEFQDGGLLI